MAITGPRPKPTSLRILEGNPSRRPLNDKEAHPDKEIPKCPDHLNEEAQKEWERISNKLFDLCLLTEIDGQALAMYCQAYANWKEATEQIKKTGMIIRAAKNNYPILNPYMSIANRAFEQMLALLAEFGMTPASRSRITVEKSGKKKDPMEKFFYK